MSEEKKNMFTELEALIDLSDDYQRRYPEMNREKLIEKGEYILSVQALTEKNVKDWCEIQQLQLKREELALRRGKLELEQEEAKENKPKPTREEKEAKVKQVFGM